MWTFVPPIPTELSKHGQTVGQTKLCLKNDVSTQLRNPETAAWNKPTKLIG